MDAPYLHNLGLRGVVWGSEDHSTHCCIDPIAFADAIFSWDRHIRVVKPDLPAWREDVLQYTRYKDIRYTSDFQGPFHALQSRSYSNRWALTHGPPYPDDH